VESIAKRREGDIANIVNSVEKIAQQFKQLQVLVIEQGTLLDRIDYNLSKSEENAKKAKQQLKAVRE